MSDKTLTRQVSHCTAEQNTTLQERQLRVDWWNTAHEGTCFCRVVGTECHWTHPVCQPVRVAELASTSNRAHNTQNQHTTESTRHTQRDNNQTWGTDDLHSAQHSLRSWACQILMTDHVITVTKIINGQCTMTVLQQQMNINDDNQSQNSVATTLTQEILVLFQFFKSIYHI